MLSLGFGRSQARVQPEGAVAVRFDDVGIDEAKTELQEVVTFLKEPERFTAPAPIPAGSVWPAWNRQNPAGPRYRR